MNLRFAVCSFIVLAKISMHMNYPNSHQHIVIVTAIFST